MAMKVTLSKRLHDTVLSFEPAKRKENDKMLEIYKSPNSTELEKQEAKDWLVCHNLLFILDAICKRYSNHMSISGDDLLSIGIGAFIKSIEKFDLTKGFSITTYASNWIRHDINRMMTKTVSPVSIPANVTESDILRIIRENPKKTIEEIVASSPKYKKLKIEAIRSLVVNTSTQKEIDGNEKDEEIEENDDISSRELEILLLSVTKEKMITENCELDIIKEIEDHL